MEIQSYVFKALFYLYFKVPQPIKFILNIHKDYKRLLPVCEAEIVQVTVMRIEVFSSYYVDFWWFSAKSDENSLKGYLGFLLMFIKTDKVSINIAIQS